MLPALMESCGNDVFPPTEQVVLLRRDCNRHDGSVQQTASEHPDKVRGGTLVNPWHARQPLARSSTPDTLLFRISFDRVGFLKGLGWMPALMKEDGQELVRLRCLSGHNRTKLTHLPSGRDRKLQGRKERRRECSVRMRSTIHRRAKSDEHPHV